MKIRKTFILIIFSIIMVMSFAITSFAGSQSFTGRCSGTSEFISGYQHKLYHGQTYNGRYKVRFDRSSAGVKINLFTQIRNANQRSGDMLTPEGTTNWGVNTMKPGQSVRLHATRQYSSDGIVSIYGHWSPDRE